MLKMFSKVFQCLRLDYIACTISNWSENVRKLNGHQHRCTVTSPKKKTRLCFYKLLGFALIEKEVASAVPSVENLQDIQVHIFKTLSFLFLSISSQHQKIFFSSSVQAVTKRRWRRRRRRRRSSWFSTRDMKCCTHTRDEEGKKTRTVKKCFNFLLMK